MIFGLIVGAIISFLAFRGVESIVPQRYHMLLWVVMVALGLAIFVIAFGAYTG